MLWFYLRKHTFFKAACLIETGSPLQLSYLLWALLVILGRVWRAKSPHASTIVVLSHRKGNLTLFHAVCHVRKKVQRCCLLFSVVNNPGFSPEIPVTTGLRTTSMWLCQRNLYHWKPRYDRKMRCAFTNFVKKPFGFCWESWLDL